MNLRRTLVSLPRDARDTLFLLFVIVWVIAPQVSNLPVWTSLLAGGLLLWRGWLAWKGRPLPGRWTVGALLVVAVAGTLFTHRTILGRDAGVTLVVMLLALKMLELRARRDAMVVFFLGFFTMLSNFFFSQSLLTAAAMLVALLGLLMALVNAHMPVGRPPLAQTFRMAGTMALLGAPIMVALFMLFPRMAPLWGMPGENLTGRSGLSGTMKIGEMAEIALDERVAIRLRFAGAPTDVPPQSALYFRGPVMTAFDGRQWQAEPFREDSAWAARAALPANLQVSGPAVRYEVTLEPQRQPWLMVLEATPEAPELPNNMRTYMTQDLQWMTSRPITEVMRYQAVSYPEYRHGPQQSVRQLRVYTELPPGFNPRTLALAAQMRADPALASGGTSALVNAALQRLRTGGYTYTLDPGVYGEHTADEFWFDRKEGFCEHIASAFVVLMRALDVPARIVTGYQGGERNPVDGYWTVRNADAHAWAEVWMEGRGWVRVDPTGAVSPGRVVAFQRLQAPQGALAAAMGALSPGMVQNLRAVWEAVNNNWNQWVLNYTQSRQMDLLKALGFESPSWQDLTTVLGTLVIAAALGGMGWSLWERSQHDPWLRLLARTRQRLARAGLPLPETLPPRAMAERVRAQFGAPADAVADWLLRLERLRYAPHPDTELGTLRRAFRTLPWPKK
ncbi:protein-glutamine gamma-glutamyltransferase TgpA [Acidovorax sp. A79]|uniref:transglutaminase TgpA family protein n=1 Tax=Acidovorax sp. A79 TaxID=3056107 RepID=UPI0034E8BDE1